MRYTIHDISVPLFNGMLTWPSDPKLRIRRVKEIGTGSKANLSEIGMSAHAGTHMDAPLHFLRKGRGIDEIPVEKFMVSCFVKEVKGSSILKEDVKVVDYKKYRAVLFKTKNSRQRLLYRKTFYPSFVHLSLEAAEVLVKKGIEIVGIDYLSIEKYQGDGSVHRTLLKNNVVIIETLDLTKVKEGGYTLIIAPLKIKKGDGAPSRALLIEPKILLS